MIGQDTLISKLKSYSITTLSHSILLLGDVGCGKHTLVNELGSYFNVDVIDISQSISLEALEEISSRAIPTFYIIDSSLITERQQNIILKSLEEPSQYVYIFILATAKTTLLDTIINRCVSYEFEPYSRETLKQFLKDDNEDVLDVCTTPGQVLSMHVGDLLKLKELCMTIITKIDKANYPNTLSITNKINLKDEFDKYDINVFFNVLLNTICKELTKSFDNRYVSMYNLIMSYKKRLRDSRLNKELFMENFLTNLWEFVR